MNTFEEALLAASILGEYTPEEYCVIGHDLRKITMPSNLSIAGVENDSDVHVIYFKCPRMYGPTDLSEFDFRINYLNANNEGDIFPILEKNVYEDYITFEWLVGHHACKYQGNIRFIVCARIVDNTDPEHPRIAKEYNTAVHTLPVLTGLEIDTQAIYEENYDVIETILQHVEETLEDVDAALTTLAGAVHVGDDTPSSEYAKFWVKETSDEIIVPTYDEFEELEDDVDELKSAVAYVETDTETVVQDLTFTWTSGYVDPADGQAKTNANLQHSNSIPVNPGDVIKLGRETDGANINTIRFLAVFKNGVVHPSLGGGNVAAPFTVPEGADSIIISISLAYGNATGTKTYTVTTTTIEPILKPKVDTLFRATANDKPERIRYEFDLSANATYTAQEDFQDQCGYRIAFNAKVSSISGEIKIGKGIGQTYGGGIGFDGTNLYQYFGTTSSSVRSQAHGLTIKDYVSLVIDVGYNSRPIVTLSTNGGSYTWTVPYWRVYYGALSASTVNALADCSLSYTSEAAEKDIWVFGDSYISFMDPTRWAYYLVQNGYTDYLLNGYPGRNSTQALTALRVALSLNHIPRKLLWLMGMNDKDTSTAPNANWLSSLEEVKAICTENHIELILATIPEVPSTAAKNTYKNAYVKDSGYRYIDFAAAVSADSSSTWYSGMLSSDNIHPDTQGAIALYNCVIAEVPELLDSEPSDAVKIVSQSLTTAQQSQARANIGVQDYAALALDTSLTQSGQAADAKATGDAIENGIEDVTEQLNDLTDLIFDTDVSCKVNAIPGATYVQGSANAGGGYIPIQNLTTYDTYYKVLDKDSVVWFDSPQTAYVAFTYGTNYTGSEIVSNILRLNCSNSVRYRKSESNLPTAENPLTIPAGSVVAITLTAGGNDMIYGLSETQRVGADFVDEVEETMSGDDLTVEMSETAVVIHSKKYHVKWDKVTTTQGYQWNIRTLYGRGENVLPSSTDIIGVLQYYGENNFMGGVHGNESNTEFSLWSNGSQITQSGKYHNVRIWMNSHLYSVNDPTVNAVDRFVQMDFDANGWRCRNTFKIISPGIIANSYASGLFAFGRTMVDLAATNIGPVDLTSTTRQLENEKLKQIQINFTNNLTVTLRSDTGSYGFVTYRSQGDSYKVYFAEAKNLAVAAGDIITGACEYMF